MKRTIQIVSVLILIFLALNMVSTSIITPTTAAVVVKGKKKKKKAFKTAEPYLIDKNVKKISGNHYLKDGKLYKFTRTGKQKLVYDKGVKQFFAEYTDNLCLLNKKKRVLYSGDYPLWYFGYKYWTIDKCKLKVFAKNVDKLFFRSGGVGFVRNNRFYAYGGLEFSANHYMFSYDEEYSDEEYFNDVHPPYLVRYTGFKAKEIADVRFTTRAMNITLKSGDAYYINPYNYGEAKEIPYDKIIYDKKRNINDYIKINDSKYAVYNGFVDEKTIHSYDFYSISTDSELTYYDNFGPNLTEEDKIKIQGVKKYLDGPTVHTRIILDENNCLYGWGRNDYNLLSSESSQKIYGLDNKVLIAKNVKDFSIRDGCNLYYLKKNGKLFFRGKACN